MNRRTLIRALTLAAATAPLTRRPAFAEGGPIRMRDLYNKDLEEVLVAGEAAYAEASEFMRMLMPQQASKVRLYRDGGLFAEDPITEAARAHGVEPAQVVLRWHTQIGSIPIPKSANPDRQRQNADIFGFSLTPAEVAAISGLERGRMKDRDPLSHEEM